ncbi:MAG: hypothetical protein QFX31_08150 [Methanothrix sp.]|uniref:DUF7714 family protein n=1 Tax=Methanothrix sp. TaxID=90426 RepID=UPI0032AF37DE|nr:hypothetical protein [Methanothrix sp.]
MEGSWPTGESRGGWSDLIFPEDYKQIGISREPRRGDPVYFATRYLISYEGSSTCIYRVESDGEGFMRRARDVELISSGDEIVEYPEIVNTRNRARLIRLAMDLCRGSVNTVIFRGPDEHVTFVHDPDPGAITEIEILDVKPPEPPWLVYVIEKLEECGVIGDLTMSFRPRVLDLRSFREDDVYFPCRASGLGRSLDADRVTSPVPKIVGCEVSREIFRAVYGEREHIFTNICPVSGDLLVPEGPFITRCCRSERRGLIRLHGHPGVVVHWGDGPHQIEQALRMLAGSLKESRR